MEQPVRQPLVGRISTLFVKNYRITSLLFVSILGLGLFAYTNLLKVEGFPAVEVPVVFVQASYVVNDVQEVNRAVTEPLEHAAGEIAEVTKVTSTTTPIGAFVIAEFSDDTGANQGLDLLEKSINQRVQLPEGASLEFRIINAGAIDGEHDLIFNVSGPGSLGELTQAATDVASKVEQLSDVARAEVLPLIEEQLNPLTGTSANVQTSFNRVGYRDGDTLTFEPAVAIGVVAKPDVGSVDLSTIVKKEVERLQKEGRLDGFTVTYGGDSSPNVLDQRHSLEENVLMGFIMAVILTMLIMDWRAAIVGGIFIPLVFAGVCLGLYLIGYSLNIISLFSFILVLGMFVDNATVVIDALERSKAEGRRGLFAVSHAMGEIGTSVVAGTWTNALVFVPMMFISGVLGKFIILIPVTVITALAVSLFLALTVIPWLGNLFIKDRRRDAPIGPSKNPIVRFLDATSSVVQKASTWTARFVYNYLGRRWKVGAVIVVTLALVAIGSSFAGRLNFSVFPPAKDADQITVQIEYPTGTTIVGAQAIASDIEDQLGHVAGEDLVAVTYFGANDKSATLIADLTDIDKRERTAPQIVEALQAQTDKLDEARVTVKVASVGPPTEDYQLSVQVSGNTFEELKQGTDDVKDFLTDRELPDGERVTEVIVERFDVLTKIDGQRVAFVRASISDPNKTNDVLELQKAVEEKFSSEQATVDLGQEGENVDSFASAGIALIIALIVMYALLVAQFNSFTQPFLIFLAIPFSFPVLFPALFYTNNSLSFFVMLGMISLAGVVVNNTIMLVSQANQSREEGLSARDAISIAVRLRWRALFATSLTTIVGLIPLAISDPFWEPLAYTMIFGLASSVLLVVFAFPAFYLVIERLRGLRKRRGTISA